MSQQRVFSGGPRLYGQLRSCHRRTRPRQRPPRYSNPKTEPLILDLPTLLSSVLTPQALLHGNLTKHPCKILRLHHPSQVTLSMETVPIVLISTELNRGLLGARHCAVIMTNETASLLEEQTANSA